MRLESHRVRGGKKDTGSLKKERSEYHGEIRVDADELLDKIQFHRAPPILAKPPTSFEALRFLCTTQNATQHASRESEMISSIMDYQRMLVPSSSIQEDTLPLHFTAN